MLDRDLSESYWTLVVGGRIYETAEAGPAKYSRGLGGSILDDPGEVIFYAERAANVRRIATDFRSWKERNDVYMQKHISLYLVISAYHGDETEVMDVARDAVQCAGNNLKNICDILVDEHNFVHLMSPPEFRGDFFLRPPNAELDERKIQGVVERLHFSRYRGEWVS